MPEAEFLAWIVGFSLLPWLMVSQIGLQPGVLFLVGGLRQGADEHQRKSVARVALRMSACQYIAFVVAGGLLLFLLSRSTLLPVSLERILVRPGLLVLLSIAGLFGALASVGNAFMVATGAARRTAALTAFGAGLFVVGAGAEIVARAKLTAMTLSAVLCVGMAAPAIGVLCRIGWVKRGEIGAVARLPLTALNARTQLNHFVAAQAFWVIPGLLVSGLDNILVAEFDPSSVRIYSMTLAVLTLASGAAGALASPYISHLSELAARGAGEHRGFGSWTEIERPLMRLTRTSVLISGAAFVSGFLPLLGSTRWYPLALDGAAVNAIPLLAAGISIRILTIPLATLAVAAQRQRALFPSSIGEATFNAVASVFLGLTLGAVGVASGTLMGSLVAIALHGWAALRLLRDVPIRQAWWLQTVLLPATLLALTGLVTMGMFQR